jgi:hypothetical protein
VSGRSGSSTSAAGPTCRAVAISRRPRSPSCSRRIWPCYMRVRTVTVSHRWSLTTHRARRRSAQHRGELPSPGCLGFHYACSGPRVQAVTGKPAADTSSIAPARRRSSPWRAVSCPHRTTSRRAGRDCCSATNGAVCSHPADSRRAIELDDEERQPPPRSPCMDGTSQRIAAALFRMQERDWLRFARRQTSDPGVCREVCERFARSRDARATLSIRRSLGSRLCLCCRRQDEAARGAVS